jgi:transcriptional regulator with XRE-family HTH domain
MENDDLLQELGRRLMSARRRKGISQEALAAKVNVSTQTVSNYETGRNEPQLGKLLKIVAALDAPISQVLDKLDDRRPPPNTARYEDETAILRLLSGLDDTQVRTARALLETLNKQNWGKPASPVRHRVRPGG